MAGRERFDNYAILINSARVHVEAQFEISFHANVSSGRANSSVNSMLKSCPRMWVPYLSRATKPAAVKAPNS